MNKTKLVVLLGKDHPVGDKVTLVWWSGTEHQCRVLFKAVHVLTLDDLAAVEGHFWTFDLLRRRRITFGETRSELEEGWTIGETTNAFTKPDNWSPPGTPLGKLYMPPGEWS